MPNYEVSQHLSGGQGQVSEPQVPLQGHGDEIKTPNMVYREFSKKSKLLSSANTIKSERGARSSNLAKAARSKSVDHRSLFQLMRMT